MYSYIGAVLVQLGVRAFTAKPPEVVSERLHVMVDACKHI